MSHSNEKTTSIIYRSLVEAAERFYEKDPATALEIYRSFCRYAFCMTEDVETDNEIAEIIVRQNIESLNAADERFANAVKNGNKGKDYGVMGKEYGKLGGRPRKGETREEYWERKRKESEETPPKTPLNPGFENPPLSGDKETPLTSALASSSTTTITSSLSEAETSSLTTTSSLEKNAEDYLYDFLSNPSKDYRCLLENEREFIERNSSDLTLLKNNLLNKCKCNISNREIIDNLKFLYKEKINYQVSN